MRARRSGEPAAGVVSARAPFSAATRRRARAIVFALVALWIVGGPFYRQVLGGRWEALRAWRMFHSRGIDTIEVRFERVRPDGTREPLERFAALGRSRDDTRLAERRLVGREQLQRAVRQLCGQLGAGTDLRGHARIAVEAGWVVVEDGDRNLCGQARP